MSLNVFLLLSKYLLVVSLKNVKQSCINIVIGLKNILCWNLVKSALDKEDRCVPVCSPFFNCFIYSFSVQLCPVLVDYKEYL